MKGLKLFIADIEEFAEYYDINNVKAGIYEK